MGPTERSAPTMPSKGLLLLGFVVGLRLAANGAGLAQEVAHLPPVADERRTDVLSENQETATPTPGSPGKNIAPIAPFAGWKDGFYLWSAEKEHSLRITGQMQSDYREFFDNGDTTDIDTFLVRRARLGIEATVFKYFDFRLLPDFAQSQTRIQDAYLNVHYWDTFQVEAGKFKQPFSYEQLIQDRFVPTLERSMIDQLVPARDEGVMFHGQKLLGDRLDYGVAVSHGERDGDADTNNSKDIAGRVAFRPLDHSDCWPLLRGLQVGISGGTGIERQPINPMTLRTPATVPWFQFNSGVRADGVRTRWSPELSYFYGPLGFAAQYFSMEQEIQPAPVGPLHFAPVNVPFDGFYFLTTVLLTGEERTTFSQAIKPLRPFNPHCPFQSFGAWEVVTRVSRLDVGSVVFTPGPTRLADPTLYSSGATELTLGFNWYLNQYVRVQLNWEHAWFDDPVRLGPGAGGLFRTHDSALARFQVIF